jgi:hypothetical protein
MATHRSTTLTQAFHEVDRWQMSSEPSKGLAEADVLVRLRLKEAGLGVSHLVMAVTPDGEVVLRSNVSSGALRSFGEDLKNSRTKSGAGTGRHDALIVRLDSRGRSRASRLIPIARKGPPGNVRHLVLQHQHREIRNLRSADRALVMLGLVHRIQLGSGSDFLLWARLVCRGAHRRIAILGTWLMGRRYRT